MSETAEVKMVRIKACQSPDTPWRGPWFDNRMLERGDETVCTEEEALRLDQAGLVVILGDA